MRIPGPDGPGNSGIPEGLVVPGGPDSPRGLEDHRDSGSSWGLRVLGALGGLGVLKVLGVLDVLRVLGCPGSFEFT